jgi:sorbitol-specific phosphotransferase system component IIBC
MECLLQYLDDLDDLYGMFGLVFERLRRFVIAVFALVSLVAGAAAGTWLAFAHVPLAAATSILLFVTLLYRSATSSPVQKPQSA